MKNGSSGDLRLGYWLNQISGYNPKSQETFPILLYIYSTLQSGFKSANYNRIQTLLGLTILSWLVLIKINEHARLREVALKEARMEKDNAKHRPRFIYYRLLRGIQNMFAGIKRIFC